MFIAEEIVAAAGLDAAVSRLTHVINHGVLRAASLAAYEDGQTALLRIAGPERRAAYPSSSGSGSWRPFAVARPSPSRCDGRPRVPPVPCSRCSTQRGARREGEEEVRLGLCGSYRPPLGRVGAALNRTVLHEIATATVHSLLRNVGHAVADPEPGLQPRTSQESARPQITPEEA